MRNLWSGAAALALLAGMPAAAQTVCQKMKVQYPQGVCDDKGAFHTGDGTVVSANGQRTSEAPKPRMLRSSPPPRSPSHSGTSGRSESNAHSGTSGTPQ